MPLRCDLAMAPHFSILHVNVHGASYTLRQGCSLRRRGAPQSKEEPQGVCAGGFGWGEIGMDIVLRNQIVVRTEWCHNVPSAAHWGRVDN